MLRNYFSSKRIGECGALILSSAIGLVGLMGIYGSESVSATGFSDLLTINPVYQKYEADKVAGLGDKWVIIPNKYISVSNGESGKGGTTLPSKYNLVTSGYATVQKNQGMDGDCWAYAITTSMESYLKKNMGVSIEFAPKQLDYVMTSATDYGKYFKEKFNIDRGLGTGGNFYIASIGLRSQYVVDRESSFFQRMKANDDSLKDYNSFKQYNDIGSLLSLVSPVDPYTKEMTESQIFGEKADYLVDGFQHIEATDVDAVAKVKRNVYNNGAMYVATYAPGTENCWDNDSSTVVDRGKSICGSENGHAMAIVGWDDDYEYTDPATDTVKKGAFILQNSYGKKTLFNDYDFSTEKYMNLLQDYGVLEGKTEAEIAEIASDITDSIENYDPYEFLYLAYDFEKTKDDSTIDFVSINSMKKNDFLNVYNMNDSSVTVSEGKLFFSLKSNEPEAITALGMDLLAIPDETIDFNLGLDLDNDGKSDYNQKITFASQDSGRKTITLDRPQQVDGDFSVILSSKVGRDDLVFKQGNDKDVSPLVYTSKINKTVEPEDEDDKDKDKDKDKDEDDIKVPNTGNFTNGDMGLKICGIVATVVLITATVGITLTVKNKDRLHRMKFEKKHY